MSALSSVLTFVLFVRAVLLRLIVFCFFVFSLSFSLTFDGPIICSFSQLFSLLQKADSLLIIYNAGIKNDLPVNDFRIFRYVFASICTKKAVSLVIIITP